MKFVELFRAGVWVWTSQLISRTRRLAVGHQAPVLHRACREVGDGDHVDLRQGVGDAEVVVVEVQRAEGAAKGILALAEVPWAREDAGEGAAYW